MNFSDNDVPEFADVVPDTGNLEGEKMPIEDILNLPLIFTGWEISKSKIPRQRPRFTLPDVAVHFQRRATDYVYRFRRSHGTDRKVRGSITAAAAAEIPRDYQKNSEIL